MKRSLQTIKDNRVYDNCQVLGMDGTLMFYCHRDKAQWYLDHDLAEEVSEDPLCIKLLFEPNGRGHQGDPFGLTPKKNICVVCGKKEELTRHHIVPYVYRKYFPSQIKRHSHHEVVALCLDCHDAYEEVAEEFRQELAVEYNAPFGGYWPDELLPMIGASKAAYALVTWGDKIPDDRREELFRTIREYTGQESVSADELTEISNLIKKQPEAARSHGQRVVSQVDDLQSFVVRWRQHFLDTMSPNFMPEHWDVNRDIFKKDY